MQWHALWGMLVRSIVDALTTLHLFFILVHRWRLGNGQPAHRQLVVTTAPGAARGGAQSVGATRALPALRPRMPRSFTPSTGSLVAARRVCATSASATTSRCYMQRARPLLQSRCGCERVALQCSVLVYFVVVHTLCMCASTQRCSRCPFVKPASEFPHHRRSGTGLLALCLSYCAERAQQEPEGPCWAEELSLLHQGSKVGCVLLKW